MGMSGGSVKFWDLGVFRAFWEYNWVRWSLCRVGKGGEDLRFSRWALVALVG